MPLEKMRIELKHIAAFHNAAIVPHNVEISKKYPGSEHLLMKRFDDLPDEIKLGCEKYIRAGLHAFFKAWL